MPDMSRKFTAIGLASMAEMSRHVCMYIFHSAPNSGTGHWTTRPTSDVSSLEASRPTSLKILSVLGLAGSIPARNRFEKQQNLSGSYDGASSENSLDSLEECGEAAWG